MVVEWMEGGFFFIQHIDAHHGEQKIKGVEYIGFDVVNIVHFMEVI
jgi:hypothetical protein